MMYWSWNATATSVGLVTKLILDLEGYRWSHGVACGPRYVAYLLSVSDRSQNRVFQALDMEPAHQRYRVIMSQRY